MTPKKLLLLLSLIGLPLVARGEDQSCLRRDYSSELPGELAQKGSSHCFAYSTSLLLTQKMHERVSAEDLAVTFYGASAESVRTNRDPKVQNYLKENPSFFKDLKSLRDDGDEGTVNCDPNDHKNESLDELKSAPFSIRRGPLHLRPHQLAEEEDGLDQAEGDVSSLVILAGTAGYCRESDYPSDPDETGLMLATAGAAQQAKEDKAGACSGVPQTDPTSGLANETSNAIFQVFKKSVNERCRRKSFASPPIPVVTEGRLPTKCLPADEAKKVQARIAGSIDDGLDYGRIVSLMVAMKLFNPKKEDGFHYVTVIGRQKINGECRYRIRNSWGPNSCEKRRPELAKHCDQGDLWLTKDEMAPFMESATYLKPD